MDKPGARLLWDARACPESQRRAARCGAKPLCQTRKFLLQVAKSTLTCIHFLQDFRGAKPPFIFVGSLAPNGKPSEQAQREEEGVEAPATQANPRQRVRHDPRARRRAGCKTGSPGTLPRLAQQWNYILRGRARWASDPDLRSTIADRAIEDLNSIGVHRDFLRQLALVDRIEVELHDWDRSDADATRINEAAAEFPWEYLISAARAARVVFNPCSLRGSSQRFAGRHTAPARAGAVRRERTGPAEGAYVFGDEEDRIRAAVGARPFEDDMLIKKTPQISELREEVKNDKWDAIHVTGIDTHQVDWSSKDFTTLFRRRSRLSGTTSPPRPIICTMEWCCARRRERTPVRYDRRLADVLGKSEKPPNVVT